MASAEQDIPIFRLPDELLMEIFSYIIYIPEKMKLEQVSKRIRYISSRPQSWKGIHKLEMCDTGNNAGIFLNGIGVPFAKWPAAIQLLLDRTNINKLAFDPGSDNYEYHTVFPLIMEVFNQNRLKMKLKFLMCKFWSDVNQLSWISIQLLQISAPYLEKFELFVFDMKNVGPSSLIEIWPIVSECNSLKSFTFFCTELSIDWTALTGKPLTELAICLARNVPGYNDLVNLIELINNATASVQKLLLTGLDLTPQNNHKPFKYFCDNLNENSRKKLRNIKHYCVKADEINHLYLIPSIFPNLEYIEILVHDRAEIDNDQFITMAVSFLKLAHSQSSYCWMEFELLTVGGNVMEFKENLQLACQNEGITAQFDDIPAVYLSKSGAHIQINEFFDEFEETDDDDENFE